MLAQANQETWDPELKPVAEFLFTKIRTRRAAEVGRRSVDYFRGSDFKKLVAVHAQLLSTKFPKLIENSNYTNEEDVNKLAEFLIRKKFIYRAEYTPLGDQNGRQGVTGTKKLPKWPKRLQIARQQFFDENCFYVIQYEASKTWRYVFLGLIVSAVLLMCLFPVWPLKIKIGLWYVSVSLLTFIFAIIILRLIVFICFWFMGIDFWIYPNLFDEEAGIIESFTPLYSFIRRADNYSMLLVRFICALMFAGAIYQLSQTHSVSDVGLFAKQSFLDVLDWGHHKLTAPPNMGPSYPSISDIENDAQPDKKEGEEYTDVSSEEIDISFEQNVEL